MKQIQLIRSLLSERRLSTRASKLQMNSSNFLLDFLYNSWLKLLRISQSNKGTTTEHRATSIHLIYMSEAPVERGILQWARFLLSDMQISGPVFCSLAQINVLKYMTYVKVKVMGFCSLFRQREIL